MLNKYSKGQRERVWEQTEDEPRHSSEDDQIGLLLVVSYDGVLHVTVESSEDTEERLLLSNVCSLVA